jgi:hypothetical protein
VTISYAQAIGGARLKTALIDDAVAAGATPPDKLVRPSGLCGRTERSIRDWKSVAPGRRTQVVGKTALSRVRGRLLCFSSTGWSAIEWTDPSVDVLAKATGKRRAPLYAWWTTNGGPLED